MKWRKYEDHLWVPEGKDFEFEDIVADFKRNEREKWEGFKILENVHLGMNDYIKLRKGEDKGHGFFDLRGRAKEATFVTRYHYWWWIGGPHKERFYAFFDRKKEEEFDGIQKAAPFTIVRSREMVWDLDLVGRNGEHGVERKFTQIPKMLVFWRGLRYGTGDFILFYEGRIVFKHMLMDGTPCVVSLNLRKWASRLEDANGELVLNKIEELEDLIVKFKLGG